MPLLNTLLAGVRSCSAVTRRFSNSLFAWKDCFMKSWCYLFFMSCLCRGSVAASPGIRCLLRHCREPALPPQPGTDRDERGDSQFATWDPAGSRTGRIMWSKQAALSAFLSLMAWVPPPGVSQHLIRLGRGVTALVSSSCTFCRIHFIESSFNFIWYICTGKHC